MTAGWISDCFTLSYVDGRYLAVDLAGLLVDVVVQVKVVGLVLLVVGELGVVLVHDLSESSRLLLSGVLVGVEVGNLDTELVLVGVGNLDVVLVGEQVTVVGLKSTESESLSSLGQVGVLVGVLRLSSGQVVSSHGVLVGILVLRRGIGLLVLSRLTVVSTVHGGLAQAGVVVGGRVVVVESLVGGVVGGVISGLNLLSGGEAAVGTGVVLSVAGNCGSDKLLANFEE
jgi:hypothetical protein